MSRTKKALHGTLASFVQYALQVLLQFLLAPMVLQHAGQNAWGAYAVIIQAITYLGFLDLGFNMALDRYLANASGLDDHHKRFNLLLTTGRSFLLGTNLIWAFCATLLALNIGRLLSLHPEVGADAVVMTDAEIGVFMLALWAAVRTPIVLAGATLIALQELAAYNIICTVANFIRLGGALLLVSEGYGLVGLMGGHLSAEVFEKLVCYAYLRRKHPEVRPWWGIPDRAVFMEMLKFGSHAMVINVGMRLMFYSDNLVVGVVISAAAASIYYSTLMPAQQAWSTLCRMISNSLPAVNELYGRSAFAQLRTVFLKIHRYNLLLAIPLAAGIELLNHDVLRIWLKDHAEQQYGGELMTLSLAVIAVMITAGSVNFIFVMATGRIRQISYLYLLVGGIKLVLSIVVAKWLGLRGLFGLGGLGAVTAMTALATAVTFINMQIQAQRELGLTWGEFLRESVWPAMGRTIVGLPVLWFLVYRWPPTTLFELAWTIASYAAIQGGISFWALEAQDRQLIIQQAGQVLHWPRKAA